MKKKHNPKLFLLLASVITFGGYFFLNNLLTGTNPLDKIKSSFTNEQKQLFKTYLFFPKTISEQIKKIAEENLLNTVL